MYVQRLDARIDKLEKANLFVEKNSSQMASFDDQFLNLFPLKSTEDLTKIEQMITSDKEFEFKIVGLLFPILLLLFAYNMKKCKFLNNKCLSY